MTEAQFFHGYQLRRPLGEGWLGPVYAATDLDGGKTVALRVLADANASQSHLTLQLERLLIKVASLSHRHLLPTGTLQERERRVWYTMDLAERGSVRQLLQFQAGTGQPTDLVTALDLVRQAAAGLAYAHGQGLMHGNLKPENLLLQPGRALLGREGYTVQLGDFGLAELRVGSYGTHDRAVVNALSYMSPEQCRGIRGELRTDLYALGVILYELVTGLVPFETRDPAEALEKHQHVAPAQPTRLRPELPADVEEIILTCLAKRPEDRYANAEELEGALQHALNSLLPSGPEPTVRLPTLPALPVAPKTDPARPGGPQPRLLVYSERHDLLREQPLEDAHVTVGRAPGNTVVLEHVGVSRHHLNIEFSGGQAFVTELSATNTSMMDGLPLPAMTRSRWPYGVPLYLRPYWLVLQGPQERAQVSRIVVRPEVRALTLVPGQATSLHVTLANTGRTVDHFRVSISGIPETWVLNAYHEVQLNPGTQGSTVLNLLVPKHPDSRAGEYDATVLAGSREDPTQFGRAPLAVTVTPFYETKAELSPPVRRTWRRTHYVLGVRNLSNTPITYSPAVRDNEGQVRLLPRLGDVVSLPTSGDPRNMVSTERVKSLVVQRVQQGLGRIRVDTPRPGVTLPPGEHYEERLNVRLPIRWVGNASNHHLLVDPNPDDGAQKAGHHPSPATGELHHNPLVPLWMVPLLLGLLAALGWWFSRPPTITQFALGGSSTTVPAGKPFDLRWTTSGARRVEILELAGQKLPTNGQTNVNGIEETRKYTLVARGWFRRVERELTVTPQLPAPVIVRFDVSRDTAPSGTNVTVSWNVKNVRQVALEPFGTVPAQGKQTYQLVQDTTFRLTAQNPGTDAVTKTRAVRALGPQIKLFSVTPDKVTRGAQATLRWQVENASSVSIEPFGTVPPQGERQISPETSTTYTIQARGGTSPVQDSVAVTVKARPPRIVTFNLSSPQVAPGGTVNVRWQTEDAQTVELLSGSGSQTVGPSGVLTLPAPPESTEFVLTATNAEGEQVTQNRPLTVQAPNTGIIITGGGGGNGADPGPTPDNSDENPAGEIPGQPIVFTATPNQISGKGDVTLTWDAPGWRRIFLNGLPGPQQDRSWPGQGTTTVPGLSKTRRFTLRAPIRNKQRPFIIKTADVKVTPLPPQVVAFTATPNSLTGPGNVVLAWEVQNVPAVRIAGVRGPNADGSFPAKGTTVVPGVGKTTQFVLTAGAGGAGGAARATADVSFTAAPAQIAGFSASPTTLQGQGNVVLKWQVRNVPSVRITGVRGSNPDGTFPPSGSTVVPNVSKTTTFTLSAGGAQSTASVQVTPLAPVIVGFSATPGALSGSGTVVLKWQVKNASSVRISGPRVPNSGGTFPASGTLTVPGVSQSSTFVLNAGAAQQTAGVRVSPLAPVIVGFSASPEALTGNGPVVLKWQVRNASSVRISGPGVPNSGGIFPASGTLTVPGVSQSSSFVLSTGTAQQTANVRVTPQPTVPGGPTASVQSFTANPTSVERGQPTTLSWQVRGATAVRIEGVRGPNPDGTFPPQGSVQVPVTTPRTFRLSAGGASATARVGVGDAGGPTVEVSPDTTGLSGTWLHPFGQLRLTIDGRGRVTGSFVSTRADVPTRAITGLLTSGSTGYTLNARTPTTGSDSLSLIANFSPDRRTFTGVYSLRGTSERWCGWRVGGTPPATCQ